MTGPCSGSGVGTPKPGLSEIQFVGPAAIGGALAGLSGWDGAAVGASIGTLAYNISTFCPDGPPAMPTFDATDISNILFFPYLPTSASSLQKFRDFVGNLFWDKLCNCSSGTSTLGAPSTFPSGAPSSVVLTPTNPGCEGLTNSDGTAGPWIYPASAITGWGAGSLAAPLAYVQYLTAVPTSFRITLKNNIKTGAGSTITFAYEQRSSYSTGHSGGAPTVVLAPGASQVLTVTAVPGNTLLELYIDSVTGSGTSDIHGSKMEPFCGGLAPGGQQQPCCPPDAATQAQLDAILQMITLVQRQAAPFSYVYGANHTALSGHGSFAVSGLIGASVDVTTLPGSYGRRDGSPVELFDLGFITLGTADGYEISRRIDHDGTLLLPPAAGAFTAIGYTLSPGVVVAIRELVREP
jgi:hypothetical protein